MNSSQPLPPHVELNRKLWTGYAPEYAESGRRLWGQSHPTWGIWNIPECEVGILEGLDLTGKDTVELGCGTAYVSSWLKRMGANPIGIDITPAQLDSARGFQKEFGIEFPLLEASAESAPLPDACCDLVISEYGACIWCDPYLWIPESARLLRPGGTLIFLRNSTLSMLCSPDEGPATAQLQRDWFGMNRLEFPDQPGVEFHLEPGALVRLSRSLGFVVEDLVFLRPQDGTVTKYDYITPEWARRWPSEEMWRLRLDS